MAWNSRVLVLLLLFSVCRATIFQPISDRHRSAALELFVRTDGTFGSLEETYQGLRTFQILGIDKIADISIKTCPLIVESLASQSSTAKDLFYALRVDGFLKCSIDAGVLQGIISKLQFNLKHASLLLDYYYSVGGLIILKDQSPENNVNLEDADGIFHSIKSLSQSDGTWRYSSNGAESSTFAAGIALETLAGVVSLAGHGIEKSKIGVVKNDVIKLFDSIEGYGDGSLFFDEKVVDASEHQGPLSITSSVVRGFTAFAAVTSGRLSIPGDKILGMAYFFLGIGIPGNSKDLFNQIDSLACLENNKISIPLILSLPATVLSLTSKDQLKVNVNTVLGSDTPPLTVKLVQALKSGSKNEHLIEDQELKFDPMSSMHLLNLLSKNIDVGKYTLTFEVLLKDPEHKTIYATGGRTQVIIFITGDIKIDNAKISVLDSDTGSVDANEKLDFLGKEIVSLSANHLQKLSISFELATPFGQVFIPHQVFLKLRHESKVEHIFVAGNSGKQFEIILDFLGLVDKFYYLSGRYDIQLTVGDGLMENSFLRDLGFVDLDLPERPEKASRLPPQSLDPYSRFGPKPEISHIFRAPEKRPPQNLSLSFLGLTLLPFFGFLIGLAHLRVNLKNFPTSTLPAISAVLFHAGIGAVLLLYLFFWLKLDLFTTLKILGFLGTFLFFAGHGTLSHLAATSAKLKSA